jgi:GNAT superfamily N-acetyltransferase
VVQTGIRVAEGGDLPALAGVFGSPAYFEDRLDRQARDLGELYVSLVDGEPVGHVFLWRDEPYVERVRAENAWTPTLTRLEVTPARRGHGLGTALVAAVEQRAVELGYLRIDLGVALDNPDARRLYERLGYREWPHGTVEDTWTDPDEPGVVHHLHCHWLVKRLPHQAPDVEAWDAWRPEEVAALLRDAPVPWAVAGGWAIDLHLGRQTREHEDLEIAIPRADLPVLRPFLAGFELYCVGSGRILPLGDDPPYHQVWVCEPGPRAWRMDTFLEPGDRQTWVSHRDARVTLPLAEAIRRTAGGIPYLAPATVLFAKAKHARAKDDGDLALTLPTLDAEERAWLAGAIALAHPGHRWLELIGT